MTIFGELGIPVLWPLQAYQINQKNFLILTMWVMTERNWNFVFQHPPKHQLKNKTNKNLLYSEDWVWNYPKIWEGQDQMREKIHLLLKLRTPLPGHTPNWGPLENARAHLKGAPLIRYDISKGKPSCTIKGTWGYAKFEMIRKQNNWICEISKLCDIWGKKLQNLRWKQAGNQEIKKDTTLPCFLFFKIHTYHL